jgi:hypothetical protein
LKGKADDVEVTDAVPAFQRIERQAAFTHLLFHIHPRGEYALTPDIGYGIQLAVQNFQPEVRHAHFVYIGKTKCKPHIHFIRMLHHAVELAADVSARFLHVCKQFFYLFIDHSYPPHSICFIIIPPACGECKSIIPSVLVKKQKD